MSSYRVIENRSEFDSFCKEIERAGIVAFDTEFVSEDTYSPELALLQFATKERSVLVDPYAVANLNPWWELMCDEKTRVVVHGGQAEIRFCFRAVGKPPKNLVDVQLAEGFRGRSYPLSYSNLVPRVLGQEVNSKQTRTDWRRRPLSENQIEYALEDVNYLLPIWERQEKSLRKLGREQWAEEEFHRYVENETADATRECWSRISGIGKLRPREQMIARNLAEWRDEKAERENKPLRRVLRDDLILEIARQKPNSPEELSRLREMTRGYNKKLWPDILNCVKEGMQVPKNKLPKRVFDSDEQLQDEQVLAQFLSLALANRCAELNVAKQLVGSNEDLKQLVRWHFQNDKTNSTPILATGWRAEVCGKLIEDVLDGRVVIRVAEPTSDHPLAFEYREEE